jgi:predicted dehydrogenase
MEHAGYYLTWLIAMFGPVKSVTSFAHGIVIKERFPDLETAPDYSCASLLFHSGMVARLTCSVVAKHNHQMQVTGDTGVLEITECWNNKAKVYVRKRHVVRRRLMDSPLRQRVKIGGPTHPHVGRWGAASMNFALGPVEMLESIKENRPCLLTAELALHLNEVTLAIHSSAKDETTKKMLTSCGAILPAAWANR